MVASLDGHTTIGGRSGGLGNAGDRALFHELRGRFEAILAGAATVAAERYGPMIPDPQRRAERVARGLAEQPLAVIAGRRLDLDPQLPLLADPGSHVVVITPGEAKLAPCAAQVEYVRAAEVSEGLKRVPARSVLCEGGPTLNGMLLAQGAVDDLFLTISPLLVGGADVKPIVKGGAARLELRMLLRSEQHLHVRYEVVSSETAASSSPAS
jgi:riboflavin biosynthesis pyrimidine reductase